MNSQKAELRKSLKLFAHEVARKKGRTWAKVTTEQLKVTETPVGVQTPFALPEIPDGYTASENIDGSDPSLPGASGARVTPQDTGNLIAAIKETDDADEAVKHLSGEMTFNIDIDRDFLMTPKFAVSRKKPGHKRHVPRDDEDDYLGNALYTSKDPANAYKGWGEIAKNNLRRVM